MQTTGGKMGFAELIEHLQTLPDAKQTEVFDFVEFLVNRNKVKPENSKTLADSVLADLIKNPFQVDDFIPFSREEANAR